jgi:hypothetical protein
VFGVGVDQVVVLEALQPMEIAVTMQVYLVLDL